MDMSNLLNERFGHQREYAFLLSFAAFVSVPFFLGIYMGLLRTTWLSLLIGGLVAWLCLTLVAKSRLLSKHRPLLRRILAISAFLYGGITLYAFFLFCQKCIFPQRSLFFFPVCFVILTAYGAHQGIYTLERSAKFTSCTVMVLLFLTAVSMFQKLWAQREFVQQSIGDLLSLDSTAFIEQTIFITVVLILQSLILLLTVDELDDVPSLLTSIRRGLSWGIPCCALLYLLAAAALGAHSFERLLYPIYDMLALPGYAEYLDRTEFLMLIIFLFCESTKTISVFLAGRKVFEGQKKSTPSF